ncbi:type III-A CRISPR-associated RAMP protein Csm4 [Chlorobium phaeobacteroides]|uniref:CRISPR system Cms protein Csm4 n=1 Tax=Chlorobium phaeobacteroides (strain DSM 266 / SMG 266 / 2430) TaxID=290317 RepID=A1BI32_CHLPD|nr:type III-A CRISPR-associated RAMP protein Csm4 [Chlorobium phaeobacteroides]ABL66059.1 CRISPR-associated protein, Csm4 family [Chlorobium phaeobacteroides DSM 266]
MNTYIVHLYFKNALHVGAANSGIGIEATQDFIHSDTLWAAIANHWAILGKVGDISFDDFLNGFRTKHDDGIRHKEEPLFRISSAFPLTDNGRMYWLPKPLSVPMAFSKRNIEDRENQRKEYGKKVKQEKFIPLKVFKEWMNFEKNASDVGGAKREGISSGQMRPHATIDRISMRAQLFHSGITYFDKFAVRVGLYFLIQCGKTTKTALEKVFEVIYEAGAIGGNRNIGLGSLFEKPSLTEASEFADLFNTENTNAYCLLSLCYLSDGEIPNAETAVAYNHLLRKGWTGSLSVSLQRKRKTVYMFAEGSVFQTKLNGCLADITPDKIITPEWYGHHDVYRYGYALSVPIKIDLDD